MPVTPVEFIGGCNKWDIGLSRSLISNLYPYLGDDNLLRSIQVVAKTMPKPPHSVAERPLPDDIWESDFLASTLKRIINGRLVSPDASIVNFPTGSDERPDTCGNAELTFTKVFMNIFRQQDKDEMLFDHAGCEIFEKGGEPLFIRKGIGTESAMNLQGVGVEGIPYPPGSIFRIDTEKDLRRRYHNVSEDKLSIIPADTIRKVSFLRLSPFAVAPEDRQDLFTADGHYDSAYSADEKLIARSEMSKLYKVSRKLIDYTQSR